MTHLFADGGRIVKSTRTDYSEHLERENMVAVVKNMMKDQHKAMFVALRSGELDELIGFEDDEPATQVGMALKPLSEQFLHDAHSQAAPSAAGRTEESAFGNLEAPTKAVPHVHVIAPMEVMPSDPVQLAAAVPGAKPYAPSRPASIFSVPPPNGSSIFGEVGIDEKSLDDAILSYLAEDGDTGSAKK